MRPTGRTLTKLIQMQREIEYQKSYDVVSEVTYTGMEDGSHMFFIKRHHVDLMWDDEEDEVAAIFNDDGGVELEAYHTCSDEEVALVEEMMHELKELGEIN